jgi:glucosamine--fructose-6-phosphate aminotransferase (isomerizing)
LIGPWRSISGSTISRDLVNTAWSDQGELETKRALMCGIVGILGREPVAEHLVNALKRLEYRGYDSAGVATLENGHLERRRAEGKLRNLEGRLKGDPLKGTAGIGHTRWATHGEPNETNAHPHATDRLAVVHNGIIENFRELREELEKKGAKFTSETDTEVVAHLVSQELTNGRSPVDAVAAALPRLRGAFALVFLFNGEDGLLIGARKGSPLAIGFGEGEMYLGSDAIALAPFTDMISYLEDGDAVVLTRAGAEVRDAKGSPVERSVHKSLASALLVDKGNHRHYMAKEIHEQPVTPSPITWTWRRSGCCSLRQCGSISKALDRVLISACGTAYYAGLVGKYWFERFARLPVEIDVVSEFRYREAPLGDRQDVLPVRFNIAQARQRVGSLARLGTENGKPVARESDVVMPTLAGPEIGVAST